MTVKELIEISKRNLANVKELQIKSKKGYDKGYYQGKADALSHVIESLGEK